MEPFDGTQGRLLELLELFRSMNDLNA